MNENENITVNEADIDAAWAEEDGPSTAEAEDGQAQQQAADQQPQGEAPPQEAPASPEKPEEKPAQADQPERFTLKNRDETRQVSREEVTALAQKGWDYDAVRQERDQLRQYRSEADPALSIVKSYAERCGMSVPDYLDYCRKQELLSQGVNEQTAAAQISLEKQQTAIQAQNAEAEAERQRQQAAEEQSRQRAEARKQSMVDFLRAYPDVKPADIPKEVWERVAQGEGLTSAYTMHQNQRLQAELAAERQNKQNRQTTTGSLAASNEGDAKSEIDKWWYEDD